MAGPFIWGGVGAQNLATGGAQTGGSLLLQNPSGAQPQLELSEDPDNGTNKVIMKAPATLAADYTLTLPVDDGSANQILSTDGTGTLSWAPAANLVGSSQAITPTYSAGFGTVTGASWFYERVGNLMHLHGYFTTGTVAASIGSLILPAGFTIDYNFIGTATNAGLVGTWITGNASGGNVLIYSGDVAGVWFADGSTTDRVFFSGATSGATGQINKNNPNSFLQTGGRLMSEMWIPIVEWAAGPAGISSNAFDPTLLTNADATKLGYKRYAHGTSYNSGIAPTVTLSSGGGSLNTVDYTAFIPYQIQDATWRMKFNLTATLTSTLRTSAVFAINGVTFSAAGADGQAVTGHSISGGVYTTYCRAIPSAGTIGIVTVAGTTDEYMFSGDVALASKPTWAY